MRNSILGLVLVAPVIALSSPALADDGLTFGGRIAANLGWADNDYCRGVSDWVGSRYSALAATTPAHQFLFLNRRPNRSINVTDALGAFVPDQNGDGIADIDMGGSGSSSSSPSSGPPRVRVSSIYGAGFYYIPGTETCIQIGGYLRAGGYLYNFGGGSDLFLGAEANVTLDFRTPTPNGTLRAYSSGGFFFGINPGSGGGIDVDRDVSRLFVQLAGFTFGGHQGTLTVGRLSSTYAYTPPYTWTGGRQFENDAFQICASTVTSNGMHFELGLEWENWQIIGERPIIVAGFGPASEGTPWRASVAVADTPYGLGVAGQFGAGFQITPKWAVRGVVAASRYLDGFVGFGFGTGPDNYAGFNLSGLYQTNTPWDIVGGVGAAGPIGGTMEWASTLGAHRVLAGHPNTVLGAEVSRFSLGLSGTADWQAVVRLQYNFVP